MPAKVIQEPLYFTQRRNKEIFHFVCPHCGAVIKYIPTKDCYDIDGTSIKPVKIRSLTFAEVVYCPNLDCIGNYDGVVVRYGIYPYESWVIYDDITDEESVIGRHYQEEDLKFEYVINKYYE